MKKKCPAGRIGKYTIEGILGHGSMGSVYRAITPNTGRIVALKLLNPSEALAEFLDEITLRDIFTTEVSTMSRLHHPNIAQILDFDMHIDRPYYTMEYFCNNLGMMIGEKFIAEESSRLISPGKAIDYGCQILAGLDCMHSAGIIHRDIKPFNMMVNDKDTIKICDFGMAKLQDKESFKAEGINIGSPYYSAPEQMSDPEHVDGRSDLFSMGVLLYRMITGELPGMKEFMLSRINPMYDKTWDAFFAKALSWEADLRFQSAQEMVKELMQLELHWERKSEKACRSMVPKAASGVKLSLRSVPIQKSGTKARKVFGVDKLWQPRTHVVNRFKLTGNDTVYDETTGLIWLRIPSDYPLDRQSADDFIDTLNEIHCNGIVSWRLPTVNELLSLAANPSLAAGTRDCNENPFPKGWNWFWSCDRRSINTSWYVNLNLLYTGWQSDSCSYSVRAVTSSRT